jgi:hypothetical protein
LKIKIYFFFENNDCFQNKVKRRMAFIVMNVELQSALERKKGKVIISLKLNGEN